MNLSVIAQTIGVVAMVFNVLSYQGKKQSTVIACQLVGSLLFSVNFLLLGAYTGALMNVISAVRAVIFLFKKRLRADRPAWLAAFICIYLAVYILNFTAFGKEPTPAALATEFLPVIGMTAVSVGFMLNGAANVRRCGLIASPAWLIYNVRARSVGAIICEILTLCSVITGIVRRDGGLFKKQKNKTSEH